MTVTKYAKGCRMTTTYEVCYDTWQAGKQYRKGDIMTPQPNVAAALMEQGKIEPITDEPPVIETAAMETPHRETTIKAKRKAAAKVQ